MRFGPARSDPTNSIVILSAAKNLSIYPSAWFGRALSVLGMTRLMSICAMACNIEEFTEPFPFLSQKFDRLW